MVLALLRGESVWRSGRHELPDRARSQWGSARLRACASTPDPSGQRPTTASQRVSGHRNPDSRRSNANTAADARRMLRTPRAAAPASSRATGCARC